MAEIIQKAYVDDERNFQIVRDRDVLSIMLTYPPRDDIQADGRKVRFIEVDQESVRASDSIRLCYDYERDGWSILQASKFEFAADNPTKDMDWKEVAFIQSWGRQTETDN